MSSAFVRRLPYERRSSSPSSDSSCPVTTFAASRVPRPSVNIFPLGRRSRGGALGTQDRVGGKSALFSFPFKYRNRKRLRDPSSIRPASRVLPRCGRVPSLSRQLHYPQQRLRSVIIIIKDRGAIIIKIYILLCLYCSLLIFIILKQKPDVI